MKLATFLRKAFVINKWTQMKPTDAYAAQAQLGLIQ